MTGSIISLTCLCWRYRQACNDCYYSSLHDDLHIRPAFGVTLFRGPVTVSIDACARWIAPPDQAEKVIQTMRCDDLDAGIRFQYQAHGCRVLRPRSNRFLKRRLWLHRITEIVFEPLVHIRLIGDFPWHIGSVFASCFCSILSVSDEGADASNQATSTSANTDGP